GRGPWKRLPLTLAPGQRILSSAADADGTLWIATTQGLIKYQRGQQTLYTTAHGLSDNQITDVSQDRDGGLWIGTWSSGACKLPGEMIVSFHDVESFPNRDVSRVIEDQQGRIYVSVFRGGLAEVVNGKLTPIGGSQMPPFNNVASRILQDNLGNWWIGTDQGLFRFQGPQLQLLRGQKLTPADGIPRGVASEIYEDATGRIWFGSVYSLCWVDPAGQGPLVFRCENARSFGTQHMIRDRSGTLWLGSQHQLARFVNGSAVPLQQTDGLPETDPRAFFIDSRGWMWIGLRFKGVSMTKVPLDEDPKFVNYSTQNGLASDSVWSIAEDDFGRMYFGTGKGLDRLDLSTGRIRHFTTADGLAGDLIYHCVKDRGGNIWVATSTGLSRFDPRAERTLSGPPPIYLS